MKHCDPNFYNAHNKISQELKNETYSKSKGKSKKQFHKMPNFLKLG
jgi:hypothetical protein